MMKLSLNRKEQIMYMCIRMKKSGKMTVGTFGVFVLCLE